MNNISIDRNFAVEKFSRKKIMLNQSKLLPYAIKTIISGKILIVQFNYLLLSPREIKNTWKTGWVISEFQMNRELNYSDDCKAKAFVSMDKF